MVISWVGHILGYTCKLHFVRHVTRCSFKLISVVYGKPLAPCTQADGNGNVVTVHKASDARKLEKIHRKAGQELGLFSQMIPPPLTVEDTKKYGTLGTTSLAWRIGRAVFLAKQEKTNIVKAIVSNICD